ncbi:hypothetical protein B296_00057231 [Ensete ventricosum]|uniref:Uncharacterized protein n=1 Tax=Ensete ventricosum TaxID=4639 RepID=A0A426X5L5_ENSVE|nr:hypothetical protein B296_00057231 [Ensete ventricosum]
MWLSVSYHERARGSRDARGAPVGPGKGILSGRLSGGVSAVEAGDDDGGGSESGPAPVGPHETTYAPNPSGRHHARTGRVDGALRSKRSLGEEDEGRGLPRNELCGGDSLRNGDGVLERSWSLVQDVAERDENEVAVARYYLEKR